MRSSRRHTRSNNALNSVICEHSLHFQLCLPPLNSLRRSSQNRSSHHAGRHPWCIPRRSPRLPASGRCEGRVGYAFESRRHFLPYPFLAGACRFDAGSTKVQNKLDSDRTKRHAHQKESGSNAALNTRHLPSARVDATPLPRRLTMYHARRHTRERRRAASVYFIQDNPIH